MKTIRHLNDKAWYRLIRILFILLMFAVGFITLAVLDDDNKSRRYVSDDLNRKFAAE